MKMINRTRYMLRAGFGTALILGTAGVTTAQQPEPRELDDVQRAAKRAADDVLKVDGDDSVPGGYEGEMSQEYNDARMRPQSGMAMESGDTWQSSSYAQPSYAQPTSGRVYTLQYDASGREFICVCGERVYFDTQEASTSSEDDGRYSAGYRGEAEQSQEEQEQSQQAQEQGDQSEAASEQQSDSAGSQGDADQQSSQDGQNDQSQSRSDGEASEATAPPAPSPSDQPDAPQGQQSTQSGAQVQSDVNAETAGASGSLETSGGASEANTDETGSAAKADTEVRGAEPSAETP